MPHFTPSYWRKWWHCWPGCVHKLSTHLEVSLGTAEMPSSWCACCFCFASGPVFLWWDCSRNQCTAVVAVWSKSIWFFLFILLLTVTTARNLKTKIKSQTQAKVSQDVDNKHFEFLLHNYTGVWTQKQFAVGWRCFKQISIIEELWGRRIHSTLLAFSLGGESSLSNKLAPYATHDYHLWFVSLPSMYWT